MPSTIIENLDLEKLSFGPSKWPRKLKPAKNSKLPKLPESHFEPFGKGGWPPNGDIIVISTLMLEEGMDQLEIQNPLLWKNTINCSIVQRGQILPWCKLHGRLHTKMHPQV
jgi:hypothetical protein